MNLFRDVAIGDGCYDDGRWTTRDCGGAGSLESALQTHALVVRPQTVAGTLEAAQTTHRLCIDVIDTASEVNCHPLAWRFN